MTDRPSQTEFHKAPFPRIDPEMSYSAAARLWQDVTGMRIVPSGVPPEGKDRAKMPGIEGNLEPGKQGKWSRGEYDAMRAGIDLTDKEKAEARSVLATEEEIARWYDRAATEHRCLLAIVSAAYVVVDIDAQKVPGFDTPLDFLKAFCRAFQIKWLGDLPDCVVTASPSGGWHLWFAAPIGRNLSKSQDLIIKRLVDLDMDVTKADIDIRTNYRGVIGMPPSHGRSGKRYKMVRWMPHCPPCPPLLLECLKDVDALSRQQVSEAVKRVSEEGARNWQARRNDPSWNHAKKELMRRLRRDIVDNVGGLSGLQRRHAVMRVANWYARFIKAGQITLTELQEELMAEIGSGDKKRKDEYEALIEECVARGENADTGDSAGEWQTVSDLMDLGVYVDFENPITDADLGDFLGIKK